jgi:hypothetical protein
MGFQSEVKPGPLARRRFGPDALFVALNHALRDGQADSRAFEFFLLVHALPSCTADAATIAVVVLEIQVHAPWNHTQLQPADEYSAMNDGKPPLISIITTCKNRLSHLKVSLPAMLKLADSEVTVVDYACAEGTADWVRANYPAAHTTKVDDEALFRVARARNIGASKARGTFLLFCDADIILKPELGDWIAQYGEEDCFYPVPILAHVNLMGSFICTTKNFLEIGGYDEAFQGWGGEDRDIYERLDLAVKHRREFPIHLAEPISHGDELRQMGPGTGGMNDKRQSIRLHDLYRTVKQDIARLGVKNLDLKARQVIMDELRARITKFDAGNRPEDGGFELTVSLDTDKDKRVQFQRKLMYQLVPRSNTQEKS